MTMYFSVEAMVCKYLNLYSGPGCSSVKHLVVSTVSYCISPMKKISKEKTIFSNNLYYVFLFLICNIPIT